jgi:hypothetical protein
MEDDQQLLRRFVNECSQDAFAELVQRYVNLVYSSALRKLNGDAHRAEDVTQEVFVKLARHAPALVSCSVLSGLVVALGDVSFDALDILAPLHSQQAAEIMLRVPDNVFAADYEMMLEHLAVILKSARHRSHAWRVIFFMQPARAAHCSLSAARRGSRTSVESEKNV